MSDEARFDSERNITTIANSRIVFHCHHYNVYLQRTVDEALGADAATVQRLAAAESSRRMLEELFKDSGSADVGARLERAARLFASLGFGKADIAGLTDEGGIVALPTSHYAIGWRAKFGRAASPVCHFAAGYWAAAVAAATSVAPERVTPVEARCAAMNAADAVSGGGCAIHIEVL